MVAAATTITKIHGTTAENRLRDVCGRPGHREFALSKDIAAMLN
jgi:hypothetical protein